MQQFKECGFVVVRLLLGEADRLCGDDGASEVSTNFIGATGACVAARIEGEGAHRGDPQVGVERVRGERRREHAVRGAVRTQGAEGLNAPQNQSDASGCDGGAEERERLWFKFQFSYGGRALPLWSVDCISFGPDAPVVLP